MVNHQLAQRPTHHHLDLEVEVKDGYSRTLVRHWRGRRPGSVRRPRQWHLQHRVGAPVPRLDPQRIFPTAVSRHGKIRGSRSWRWRCIWSGSVSGPSVGLGANASETTPTDQVPGRPLDGRPIAYKLKTNHRPKVG